jgi:hypothetical protein
MPNRDNQNEQSLVLDAIDNAVVADANTQVALLTPLQRLGPVRARILSQRIDPVADPLANISRE